MGFVAQVDGKGLRLALACDASGCVEEVDDKWIASIVAVPPRGDVPSPILFACRDACKNALLAAGGEGARAVDLADWWEMTADTLGSDDDETTSEMFLLALGELADAVQRPGMPAGLTVRDAVGLGYLSRQHVAEALAAVAAT